MGLRRVIALAVVLPSVLVVTQCGDSPEGKCEPGTSSSCKCPDGSEGQRSCYATGDGYGKCAPCGDADASLGGTGGGADGSSGAAGSGASSSGAAGGAGGASGSGGAGGSGGSGGGSGGGITDAASDASSSCPAGSATNATLGACDVVLQNCPAPYTCSIQQAGATWKTECVTLGAGSKALGASCNSHSECQPTLRCTLGKCTRPCCSALESQLCGANGQCDMNINFSGGAAFLQVCTFSPPCTPWANDCPTGQPETDCHISGSKFSCSTPNYSLDAGSTVGKPCTYLNDCGDSQHCMYSSADAATGTCRWLCKASTTGAPDAGTVGGSPGKGGCQSGQKCVPYQSPSWLGFCDP